MMPTPDRVTRRTTRQQSRRQLILDAAAIEFADAGYEQATLEHIGDRVGLSKASLYYYVASKEQLLAELLERLVDHVEERVNEAIAAGGDAEAMLTALVRGHFSLNGTPHGKALSANLHAMRRDAPKVQADRYERVVAGIIERGIESGRIRPVPVRPAVKLVIGAMNGVSQWFDPAGSQSLEDVVDGVVGVLMRGVRFVDADR